MKPQLKLVLKIPFYYIGVTLLLTFFHFISWKTTSFYSETDYSFFYILIQEKLGAILIISSILSTLVFAISMKPYLHSKKRIPFLIYSMVICAYFAVPYLYSHLIIPKIHSPLSITTLPIQPIQTTQTTQKIATTALKPVLIDRKFNYFSDGTILYPFRADTPQTENLIRPLLEFKTLESKITFYSEAYLKNDSITAVRPSNKTFNIDKNIIQERTKAPHALTVIDNVTNTLATNIREMADNAPIISLLFLLSLGLLYITLFGLVSLCDTYIIFILGGGLGLYYLGFVHALLQTHFMQDIVSIFGYDYSIYIIIIIIQSLISIALFFLYVIANKKILK